MTVLLRHCEERSDVAIHKKDLHFILKCRSFSFNVTSILALLNLKAQEHCRAYACVIVVITEAVIGVCEGSVVHSIVVDIEACSNTQVNVFEAKGIKGQAEGWNKELGEIVVVNF